MHDGSGSTAADTSTADFSHHDTSSHNNNTHTHQQYEQHDINSHFHSHEDPEDNHHHHHHHKHHHALPSVDQPPLPSYGTVNYYHPPPHIQTDDSHLSFGSELASAFGNIFKALFMLLWFGMVVFIVAQLWKEHFCPWNTGSVWDIGCNV